MIIDRIEEQSRYYAVHPLMEEAFAFLAEAVDRGIELGADDEKAMNLRLAVEEAVVNVMNYAYKNEKNPDGTPVQGEVEVQAIADRQEVVFTVIDSGSPFDPTAIPDVDPTLPVEERPIGGLGIFMMRQLTDSINYKRLDEHNVTRLRKKYSN